MLVQVYERFMQHLVLSFVEQNKTDRIKKQVLVFPNRGFVKKDTGFELHFSVLLNFETPKRPPNAFFHEISCAIMRLLRRQKNKERCHRGLVADGGGLT